MINVITSTMNEMWMNLVISMFLDKLSLCLLAVCLFWLSECLSVCMCVWLWVCPSDCLPESESVWLTVCLSICLSICLSAWPSESVCLCICLSIYRSLWLNLSFWLFNLSNWLASCHHLVYDHCLVQSCKIAPPCQQWTWLEWGITPPTCTSSEAKRTCCNDLHAKKNAEMFIQMTRPKFLKHTTRKMPHNRKR